MNLLLDPQIGDDDEDLFVSFVVIGVDVGDALLSCSSSFLLLIIIFSFLS